MRTTFVSAVLAALLLAPAVVASAATALPQRAGVVLVPVAPSGNGGDNGWGNCGHNSSGGAPHSDPGGGGNGGYHKQDCVVGELDG